MRFLSLLFLVFALLVSAVCTPAVATDEFEKIQVEVSDVQALLAKPFGTRNMGMGWGGVADGAAAANVFYNPANIISLGGLEVSAESQNWDDKLDFLNGGVASRFRIRVGQSNSIYIAPGLWFAKQNDFHKETSAPSNEVETTDKYLSLALALGFATERFEFGLGAAAKPVWIDFGAFEEEATAWAYDFGLKLGGLLLDKNGNRFSGYFGASVINTGPDAESGGIMSELPTETRVGVAFIYKSPTITTRGQQNVSSIEVALNAELIDRTLQRETASGENPSVGSMIGTELRLINVFNLRIGWLDDGGGGVTSETYGGGLQFASEKFRFAADISHIPEIYSGGPSVTATGLSVAWFF